MSSKKDSLKLQYRLFGPFTLRWSDGREIKLGGKQKALLVLLLCAPDFRQTRTYLAEMLWNGTDGNHRGSVRGAIDKIRKEIKDPDVFDETDRQECRLNPDRWEQIGDSSDGAFVEGLSIPGARRFEKWLEDNRRKHANGASVSHSLVPAQAVEPRVTVAVMPFQSHFSEPFAASLGDMLAQEVTRAMSRSRLVRVIDHLSMRAIDPNTAITPKLRSVFGADYLVNGRVKASERGFSLCADFIDVRDSSNRWSRDYSGQIAKLIEGELDLPEVIANDVGREIFRSSIDVAKSRPLHEIDDHHLLVYAVARMHRQDGGSMLDGKSALLELISRAPGCASLHAWLSKCYVLWVGQGWSVNQEDDTSIASDSIKRALDLDPECGFTLAVDGFVQNNLARRFDEAAKRFDEALEFDPNNSLAWLLKGNMHSFKGEGDTAVDCTERACRISPLDPHKYFFDTLTATAHLSARNFESALSLADKSLTENRRHTSTLRVRTIALVYLDRMEEAHASAVELLEHQPKLTVDGYLKNHSAAAFETGREWAQALEKAGVPKN